MMHCRPLTRPQLALSEAEGATLSRRRGISVERASERVSARHRLVESLLPPGEGARSADEGRVIRSDPELGMTRPRVQSATVMKQTINVAQYGIGPIGAEIARLLLTKPWVRLVAAVDI